MVKEERTGRITEIKAAVKSFCDTNLNEEFGSYAQRLCDKLGRKRTLSITSGRPEIWSAAIIYVIARLNFLFDQSQKHYISADAICDFFGVKKSTASQKATLIEKACKIRMGEPEFCNEKFSDMFTLIQTPEGIVIPLSMLKEHSIMKKTGGGWRPEDKRLFVLNILSSAAR